jgi:hypothetical protein
MPCHVISFNLLYPVPNNLHKFGDLYKSRYLTLHETNITNCSLALSRPVPNTFAELCVIRQKFMLPPQCERQGPQSHIKQPKQLFANVNTSSLNSGVVMAASVIPTVNDGPVTNDV